MSNTYKYVSEQRLLYFTQKLKTKFPAASDFIDDLTSATNKAYSSNKVDSLLTGYVPTETGKGLSTNDFTDDYKQQLDDLDLTDLIDDTSDSATDKTWSVSKIMEKFAEFTGIKFIKVEPDGDNNYVLPTDGDPSAIYLMPNNGTNPNIYDEYVYLSDSKTYEKIGTTEVDLSGYVQDSDMVEITTAEIDTIIATVWS